MNIVTTCTGFTAVSKIKIPDVYSKRFKTGCEDLDELFGVDGFIPGTTFTLAAPPGSGKTSILLQTLELLHHVGKSTAYVSGEESVYQLAFTCKRLNVQSTSIANMVIIEDIFDSIEKTGIDVVILDSFPSLRSREKIHGKRLEEYLSNYICTKAKQLNCVVGIILHTTKTGQYKGSTLLPHSVDCNILVKCNEIDSEVREFNVTKNRFGRICDVAFRMTSTGFDFVKVDIDSIEKHTDTVTETNKMSKADIYKNTIMEHIRQHKYIDLKIAAQLLKCSVKAQYTLRNIALQGLIHKSGRGQNAKWTELVVTI